ncbi:uncharacterized protein LOC129600945 isoform X2 [Paramacrobiotus metropolitanus]|uniref:uncharacterized protein LOC129600945 isoform X2 n=1 Tax=Paramacrobiotus metropolitanus TaxID=2943436 RepID=UPI002445AE30|nr:uncharacterized protein LOC129600945 isoform X2 [Paramacrobiotus metropolitanus]
MKIQLLPITRKASWDSRDSEIQYQAPPKRKGQLGPAAADGREIPLPPELLVEIFQSLDSVDRQRYRRVCYAWEPILMSATMCSDERVSFDHRVYSSRWLREDLAYYPVYNCVLKHLTPATRTVCCLDYDHTWSRTQDWGAGVMGCVQQMLDSAGRRIQSMIFCRRRIDTRYTGKSLEVYFKEMADGYRALASCCDKIIYKDVEFQESSCSRAFHTAS